MRKETRNQIYNGYEAILTSQIKLLDKETFSEQNKDLIRTYQAYLQAKGTKDARIAKSTWGLRKICHMVQKDLDKLDRKDLLKLVAQINQSEYTDNTKSDYKKCLKQFFTWYEEEDTRLESREYEVKREAEKLYKYLKTGIKTTVKAAPINPGAVIKQEHIQQVLTKGCKSDMERAFISTLYAAGVRIGELLNLTRQDIIKEAGLWVLRVDGKTGERVIPVRSAVPHLAVWLNNHPNNDPEAHVWISRHNRWNGKPLRYTGARKLIDRCFKRAGLEKVKRNPHWFRHTRCTLNAKQFNDAICCKLAGHKASTMARYRHISGDDVISAFKQRHGLEEDTTKEEALEPSDCGFCGTCNAAHARYCVTCGKPMSMRVAIKDEELKNKAIDEAIGKLAEVMSDPQLRKEFEEYLQAKQ